MKVAMLRSIQSSLRRRASTSYSSPSPSHILLRSYSSEPAPTGVNSRTEALVNMMSNPVNRTIPFASEVFKKAGTYDEKKLFGVTTHDEATTKADNFSDEFIMALKKQSQEGQTAKLPTVCSGLKGLNGVPDVVEGSFLSSNVPGLPFLFSSKVRLGKNNVEEFLGLGTHSNFGKEGLEASKLDLESLSEKGVKFANKNMPLGGNPPSSSGEGSLRPLSPHLPLYQPQLSSTLSILNRISGVYLTALILTFYLLCLKLGPICLTFEPFYQSLFYSSKLTLISVEMAAVAMAYHTYIGVRHLLYK